MICHWDRPGQDRYSGTTAAAIHAYAQIPRATQDELIARFERREFADFVFIDRDSIRSASANYDPVIHDMHFGPTADRLCTDVDRSSSDSSHVETAIVVCADGYCVAAPTICSNWFVLGARRDLGAPPAPELPEAAADVPLTLAPLPPPESANGPVDLAPTFADLGGYGQGGSSNGPGDSFGGFGGGGAGGGWPAPVVCAECCAVPLTPPIPEPSTWAMLAAGLALVLAMKRRAW